MKHRTKEQVEELRAQAIELHELGWTDREAAAMLGISRGYLNTLRLDPDGSRERARKRGLKVPCPSCGGPMSPPRYKNGQEPRRCLSCTARTRPPSRWTRTTVIEAIQRWAREHDGQPPVSTDWNKSVKIKGDYPPLPSVYRNRGRYGRKAPFASWAEAIEEAGFPRPRTGYYRDESKRSEIIRRSYAEGRRPSGGRRLGGPGGTPPRTRLKALELLRAGYVLTTGELALQADRSYGRAHKVLRELKREGLAESFLVGDGYVGYRSPDA